MLLPLGLGRNEELDVLQAGLSVVVTFSPLAAVVTPQTFPKNGAERSHQPHVWHVLCFVFQDEVPDGIRAGSYKVGVDEHRRMRSIL